MEQFLICIQMGHFWYWKALLLKGSDGAHGSQGPSGPPGSPGSPGLMVYACFCILSLFSSFQHISELYALLHSLCSLWKGPPGIEGMDGKDGKPGLRVSYTHHTVGSHTGVIIWQHSLRYAYNGWPLPLTIVWLSGWNRPSRSSRTPRNPSEYHLRHLHDLIWFSVYLVECQNLKQNTVYIWLWMLQATSRVTRFEFVAKKLLAHRT